MSNTNNENRTLKKAKKARVIPGFGLTMGVTVTMLSLIVLIPLASVFAYALKLSPNEFFTLISKETVRNAFITSIGSSFIAALINVVFGLIIAWVLVKYEFPGKRLMDGMIELPFALPTAVAGIALTHLTTTEGWVGAFFQKFGFKIAYTRPGTTVQLEFIGIPFVVRAVQPVLEKIDIQYEEAANILGANSRQTMFRVILPEILPSLIAGCTMCIARGLGEYGSVVFIAGNTPYETEIAPLMIMSKLQEFDYASATSIALVMLAAAFVILFINAWLQSRASKIVSGIA